MSAPIRNPEIVKKEIAEICVVCINHCFIDIRKQKSPAFAGPEVLCIIYTPLLVPLVAKEVKIKGIK